MTHHEKSKKGCTLRAFIIGLLVIGLSGVGFIVFLGWGWIQLMERQAEQNEVLSRKKKTERAKEKVGQFETAVQTFYKKECRFPKAGVSSNKKVKPNFSDGGLGELDLSNIPLDIVYFEYRLVNDGGKRLTIIAEKDFFPDVSTNTTHTLVLKAGPNCTLSSEPMVSVLEKKPD